MSTINRYIFAELLAPFFNCLFFLTFVFLMTRIPEIINMAMNYNINIFSVLKMIVYTLPRFLEFTIPMSVTISILLTFMRLSSDNEILALRSAGMSLYRILPPVLMFCFLGAFLTTLMTVFLLPWGNLSRRAKGIEFAQSASIDLLLKERQFNSTIDGFTIYASHADIKTHTLEDVVIEDRRQKDVISISTAPSDRLIRTNHKHIYTIRLNDGIISLVNLKDKSVNNVNFKDYDIQIDLSKIFKSGGNLSKKLDERSLTELVKFIQIGIKNKISLNEALMELNEKLSIPFACFALGILSVSLGIQLNTARRSTGYGVGLVFFLLYYLLLAAGWSAGKSGAYVSFLGMWMPNAVMGILGVYLLSRSAKEKSLHLPKCLSDFTLMIKQLYLRFS